MSELTAFERAMLTQLQSKLEKRNLTDRERNEFKGLSNQDEKVNGKGPKKSNKYF